MFAQQLKGGPALPQKRLKLVWQRVSSAPDGKIKPCKKQHGEV
jgi:hypothetical protein